MSTWSDESYPISERNQPSAIRARKPTNKGAQGLRVEAPNPLQAVQNAEDTMLKLVDELFKSLGDVDAIPTGAADAGLPAAGRSARRARAPTTAAKHRRT